MRLMVGSNNLRAYVNDTQRQGWVEMCVDGKYRRVCDENWSNEEASVVCGELGLSRYGRLRVSYGSLVLLIFCASCRSHRFAGRPIQWRTVSSFEQCFLYRH